jgi:RNA polymerase subunit RPABC4/transcription elongation factor Spt4
MDDSGTLLFFVICYAIVFGVAGWVMGKDKGIPDVGALLGAVLGPIGLVITAYMEGNREHCRFCSELVSPDASICPHCQQDLWTTNFQPRALVYPDPDDVPIPKIVPQAIAIPPPPKRVITAESEGVLRVSKDGQDLGNIALQDVRNWLQSGELTFGDHYFDRGMGQWLTLDCHPDLTDLQS